MESKAKLSDKRLNQIRQAPAMKYWQRQDLEDEVDRARAAEARLEKENAELRYAMAGVKTERNIFARDISKLEKENAALKKQVEAFQNESDDDLLVRCVERGLNGDDLNIVDARESGDYT